jgi:hypothetical protein
LGKNSTTSSSLKAAGTLDASGADSAEYRKLVSRLQNPGSVAAGALLGLNASGDYTDKFSEVTGRVFIKRTSPHDVGNCGWQTEEYICAHYDVAPPREHDYLSPSYLLATYNISPAPDAPASDDAAVVAAWDKATADYAAAIAQSRTDYAARRVAFDAAYEQERGKWDRIAISGLVPCNVPATAADVGKYLVPCAGANDAIATTLKSLDELTTPDGALRADYARAFGVVERIGDDGRALVNVKVT